MFYTLHTVTYVVVVLAQQERQEKEQIPRGPNIKVIFIQGLLIHYLKAKSEDKHSKEGTDNLQVMK